MLRTVAEVARERNGTLVPCVASTQLARVPLVAFALLIVAAIQALAIAACTASEVPRPIAASPTAARVGSRPLNPPAEGPHWSYEGHAGPTAWGTLSPEFATCASGRSQSPIDIGKTSSASLPELRAAFRPAELRIAHTEHLADAVNNGHTIQVTYSQGDTLTVGDTRYELTQYHFHAPSEHTIAGKHSPMEMHLVHKSPTGGLAVIGVLLEEGSAEPRVRARVVEPPEVEGDREPPRARQGGRGRPASQGSHQLPLRRLAHDTSVLRGREVAADDDSGLALGRADLSLHFDRPRATTGRCSR